MWFQNNCSKGNERSYHAHQKTLQSVIFKGIHVVKYLALLGVTSFIRLCIELKIWILFGHFFDCPLYLSIHIKGFCSQMTIDKISWRYESFANNWRCKRPELLLRRVIEKVAWHGPFCCWYPEYGWSFFQRTLLTTTSSHSNPNIVVHPLISFGDKQIRSEHLNSAEATNLIIKKGIFPLPFWQVKLGFNYTSNSDYCCCSIQIMTLFSTL